MRIVIDRLAELVEDGLHPAATRLRCAPRAADDEMQGAVEEVDRNLINVDVGATGIELESGAAEVIDERREAATAAHRPVEQEIVGGAEDPFVAKHLCPNRSQRRIRDLAAGEVDSSDRVAEASLDTAVALVDRIGRLADRLVHSDRCVEVAQHALEVLGSAE